MKDKFSFVKYLVIVVVKVLVKYVLPAVLGWLEGDQHIFSDLL